MVRGTTWQVTFVLFVTLVAPSLAIASGVHALFDLDSLATSPFPSDWFTVRDKTQNTRLRIDLPKPDCSIQVVSDCEDIDILNTLDGFNLQPRLSIPFSGPIDVTTVSSKTVLLIKLGDARRRGHHDDDDDDDDDDGDRHGRSHRADTIGINQIVWDVVTNTLHVESDELLDQHTRYALIVTRGVKDTDGRSVRASENFERFRHGHSHGFQSYRKALLRGLDKARAAGFHHKDIVVASVFTTMSVTAILEKIRDQIKAAAVAPADFILGGPLGPDGIPVRSVRTVFPLSTITTMKVNEQISTAPTFALLAPAPRLANLGIVPGAVGAIAFGSYRSPVYLNAGRYIPQVGTRTGTPVVQGEDEVFFNLFLPAATADRPRPAGGWPVAIYGIGGGTDTKNQQPFSIAATLANRGIATIAINPPAQGAGPLSTFEVGLASGATVTFLAGGRSLDIDGDGTIGRGEGFRALPPRQILLGRDTRRQTIADFMQLVRVIEVGIDADGDGAADLDPSQIYYAGFSNGAIIGPAFAAVESSVRAAVLNAPGGLVGDGIRLPPGNRNDFGALLASREPSLINPPGITTVDGVPLPSTSGEDVQFNENRPLRNDSQLVVRLADGTSQTIRSPVVNTVPGAMQIQQLLEHIEWAYMPVDPVVFAPYLRRTLVQFAKGDQQVTNPTTTAILRAGDFADRTTYYRTDHAVATYGTTPGVAKNPHVFLLMLNTGPTRAAIARAAQEQIAVFFESDGATVIDPNEVLLQLLEAADLPVPLAPLFEVRVPRDALPEDLGFIP